MPSTAPVQFNHWTPLDCGGGCGQSLQEPAIPGDGILIRSGSPGTRGGKTEAEGHFERASGQANRAVYWIEAGNVRSEPVGTRGRPTPATGVLMGARMIREMDCA
ncbi:MAG TPA: hypothetical protein VM120_03460 [Bryobacteraceae bacterium]|nr:hypothetical protein [Bryobacteraceae bacterium]